MIDPSKFEPQGKPTHEQVRTVWDAMAKPSARAVANEMVNRGWDISWRTVARWHANEWRPAIEMRGRSKATRKPFEERGRAKGYHEAMLEELRKIPEGTVKEADEQAAKGMPVPKLDEYALIARRRDELLLLSDRELDRQEARARKVMNILIAEQAAQRAHIMVLVPKDTGSLVESLAEAQNTTLTNPDEIGDPSDARVINGKANGHAIEHAPANPLSSAIDQFLADHEVA